MKHFNPTNHINNLINSDYYLNLLRFRNLIEISCDNYFQKKKAMKVDLYLISQSISSPMGRGSDSKPLPMKFGNKNVYLVDSAQFGMEPLVLGITDMTYCYLPSFRGEENDERHLNQFYHCEAEMKGDLSKAILTAEELIKYLIDNSLNAHRDKMFSFKYHNFQHMHKLLNKPFPQITFDEAIKLLKNGEKSRYVIQNKYGRSITNLGEIEISNIMGKGISPVWIMFYDRDNVPFYQKPLLDNPDKVLNADLVFPSINGSIGGEIIGLGQRQDNIDELIQSIKRQGIRNINPYSWYINLRRHPSYQITSGFGLGIERFIAWMLALDNIADASLFPVFKGAKTVY